MRKGYFITFLIILSGLFGFQSLAQEKPNILWLVTEDMSPYLSCYGNRLIKTPNLDQLAADGIRYTHAFTNGTQCSPSRSTLISGRYAVSNGTDIHRHAANVNDSLYFPIYLRKAGYYCINNPKEDYNNNKTPGSVWNVPSSKSANYQDRPDKHMPFFAEYNQFVTHMSRVAKNIEKRLPDDKRTVHMKDVIVPPYVPDLPEVRDDISWNMDAVILMDKWVGKMIAELKESGEYDNTIIIFSSDHGGTVPRGKAYVYESGTRIPLIIHFPPKWKHLAAGPAKRVDDRLVSFVDFAPTFLSLAGANIPSFMVGKPFLTDAANQKQNVHDHVFTFRSNQSDAFAPSRSVDDGKFHLIWNFQGAYPNGTRQDYQWLMPAQQAWDRAFLAGDLKTDIYKKFWLPVPTYELYNVRTDSVEAHDLAGDPKYAPELKRLKAMLNNDMREQKDLGFIPPEYKFALQKNEPIVDIIRKRHINIDEVIDAAELASQKEKANVPALLKFLHNKNPMVQYWGASGLCGLTKTGIIKELPADAITVYNAKVLITEAEIMLAEAMVFTNKPGDGIDYLLNTLAKGSKSSGAALQNLGKLAMPGVDKIKQMLAQKAMPGKFYLRSTLINCGALPYSALFDPNEVIPD